MSYSDYPQYPSANLERKMANRRSVTSDRSRSQIRSPPTIEEALENIAKDWPFMTYGECIPVKVALQLLDKSSIGKFDKTEQFERERASLQDTLRLIVNEHHQAFNSAIGTFHGIQESITTTQIRIAELKRELRLARGKLGTPKAELAQLADTSSNLGEMLELLSRIEKAKGVPTELEELVSAKRFLSAVEVLQAGLRTVRSSELDGIGALADLQVYLGNQEHGLGEILTEELNLLLYPVASDKDDRYGQKTTNTTTTAHTGSRKAFINFLNQLEDSDEMLKDDPSGEFSRFDSIRQAVQALYNLGLLEGALDTIRGRMSIEFRRISDKCAAEVTQRHAGVMATIPGSRWGTEIDPTFSIRKLVLTDLLNTIYARFEAVSETHRAMNMSIANILDHDATESAATISRSSSELLDGLTELCRLFEIEIKSLFLDYLSIDKRLPLQDTNAGGSGIRNRNRKLFQISYVDTKQAENYRVALETSLKATVPGLSAQDQEEDGPKAMNTMTRPPLLVQPGVFNMRILLPPSMGFVSRLGEVLPAGLANRIRHFVDGFLSTVFLPLMDESLTELGEMVVAAGAAFEQDNGWASRAGHPIFQGSSRFFTVADAFCQMLDELTDYFEFGGGEVVARHVATFNDRCMKWLRAVTSGGIGGGGSLKLSGELAESEERLMPSGTVNEDGIAEYDLSLTSKYIEEESRRLSSRLQSPISFGDVQLNSRVVASLCVMHNSMSWIAAKLARQTLANRDDDDDELRTDHLHELLPSFDPLLVPQSLSHTRSASAKSIPKISSSASLAPAFSSLAAQIARLLRYEVRCHAAFFVHQFMDPKRRPFVLDRPVGRPDPEATALAQDLSALDEQIEMLLPVKVHEYVMCGLAGFVDRFLMEKMLKVVEMNVNGCGRMQLDVLVLQQNMTVLSPAAASSNCPCLGPVQTVTNNADGSHGNGNATSALPSLASLSTSAEVLDLFSSGLDGLMNKFDTTVGANQPLPAGLSVQQAEDLIRLCVSDDLRSGDRSRGQTAKIQMENTIARFRELIRDGRPVAVQ